MKGHRLLPSVAILADFDGLSRRLPMLQGIRRGEADGARIHASGIVALRKARVV
jgi:hypothetical protein